jgi:hypothetical protein
LTVSLENAFRKYELLLVIPLLFVAVRFVNLSKPMYKPAVVAAVKHFD